MINLNDLNEIKKIDSNNAHNFLELLPDQIRQTLNDEHLIKIPDEYRKVKNIIVFGMGGSHLGADLVKAVFKNDLKLPLIINNDYEVPAFVNSDSLCILSSYSGNTEETLSVYEELEKRKVKLIGITGKGNGSLENLMLKNDIPGYIFNPQFTPSPCPPRLAIGYAVFGFLNILKKIELLKLNREEIKNIINIMEINDRKWRINENDNQAKEIAQKFFSHIPILVGAEFLVGNLKILRNQICESGKNFTSILILPELNHFAMEGLAHPKTNPQNLLFIFFSSILYNSKIKIRSNLTKDILQKNNLNYLEINLNGKSKLEQSMELLQLGSYISYYLGILNQENPNNNEWVDYFKANIQLFSKKYSNVF